jgi:hypothetical protein
VSILVFAICAWPVFRPRDVSRESIAMRPIPVEPSPEAAPALMPSALADSQPDEFVKVQTEEQAKNEPLPPPAGLSQEQQSLFEAARGLPLLLVRDGAGKVTRIHVIER